jgi:hypothetical protein
MEPASVEALSKLADEFGKLKTMAAMLVIPKLDGSLEYSWLSQDELKQVRFLLKLARGGGA